MSLRTLSPTLLGTDEQTLRLSGEAGQPGARDGGHTETATVDDHSQAGTTDTHASSGTPPSESASAQEGSEHGNQPAGTMGHTRRAASPVRTEREEMPEREEPPQKKEEKAEKTEREERDDLQDGGEPHSASTLRVKPVGGVVSPRMQELKKQSLQSTQRCIPRLDLSPRSEAHALAESNPPSTPRGDLTNVEPLSPDSGSPPLPGATGHSTASRKKSSGSIKFVRVLLSFGLDAGVRFSCTCACFSRFYARRVKSHLVVSCASVVLALTVARCGAWHSVGLSLTERCGGGGDCP
jgi:putative component of membrane protein insertase Oxa1/YidC/SpoIIIJ protein YidD